MKTREIKFRAWDKKRKQMGEVIKIDLEEWEDIKGLVELKSADGKYYWMPVDDIILMQYTGLKDKNGREIYEGDIVKAILLHKTPFQCEIVGKVTFEDGAYVIKTNKCILLLFQPDIIEIIGNIYENPELLKEGGK